MATWPGRRCCASSTAPTRRIETDRLTSGAGSSNTDRHRRRYARLHRAITLLDLIIGQQLFSRSLMDNGALVEHVGAIGNIQRQLHVLLDQQNRGALRLHGAE